MLGFGQLQEHFSSFKSYFQSSDEMLGTIVIGGFALLVAMLVLLKASRIMTERIDREKRDEFKDILPKS